MSIGHLIYTARLTMHVCVCVCLCSYKKIIIVQLWQEQGCDCLLLHGCTNMFLGHIEDCVPACLHDCVTCDNGGNAPANGVIESHGSIVDVALLCLHSVDMKTFHEHPGERGHEEVMQQDGDDRTQELRGEVFFKKRVIKKRERGGAGNYR